MSKGKYNELTQGVNQLEIAQWNLEAWLAENLPKGTHVWWQIGKYPQTGGVLKTEGLYVYIDNWKTQKTARVHARYIKAIR